jgi:hypothetical protein
MKITVSKRLLDDGTEILAAEHRVRPGYDRVEGVLQLKCSVVSFYFLGVG